MALKDEYKRLLLKNKIHDFESMNKSEAFCLKPWVHLFVSHFGTVVPCCLTPWENEQALGDVNQESIPEIWNGKQMKNFRSKLLRDEKDSRCKQCYESEKMGLKSTRKMTNFLYKDKLDWAINTKRSGHSDEAKPIYWDIRISNLCNFKCRICGHHSSSQWYNDAKALDLLSYDKKLQHGPKEFDKLMDQLAFVVPDLEEVYFAGGEPLIMEEHYQILNKLRDAGNTKIKIRYATNFSQTIYKGQDVFELWSQFEDVFVHASLDDYGKRGELQRSGQKWETVVSDRKRMQLVCPNVDFLITPTISVLNIFSIGDFHRKWVEEGLCALDEFMPHTLRNPSNLNLQMLTPELKELAKAKLNKHIDWLIAHAKSHPPQLPNAEQLAKFGGIVDILEVPDETGHVKLDLAIKEYRNCIVYMESKDASDLIPEFIKYSEDLDKLRKESTKEILPELAPLWEVASNKHVEVSENS